MKAVAVFLSDETTLRRLTLAFRTRCVVSSCESFEAAKTIVSVVNTIAMIVDMRQRGQPPAPVVELIAQLHTAWPSIPIIAYVDFTPQRVRDVLPAAQAGVTELILGDYDDLGTVADRIVDVGMSRDATTQMEQVVRTNVPPHLHDFFLFCVRNAQQAMTVDSVSMRIQRSRKTLSNWLVTAQLPPPSRVVGWCRVVIAARHLEDTTRSTEKVAQDLQFLSGTALRNMVRRYLGFGPEILRKHGGFQYALAAFQEALESRAHGEQLV